MKQKTFHVLISSNYSAEGMEEDLKKFDAKVTRFLQNRKKIQVHYNQCRSKGSSESTLLTAVILYED